MNYLLLTELLYVEVLAPVYHLNHAMKWIHVVNLCISFLGNLSVLPAKFQL